MKEKIEQFIKENWISLALILTLSVIIACQGCGSTWQITGNTVTVTKESLNDSIAHHNDTINHEIRKIPQERVDEKCQDTLRSF